MCICTQAGPSILVLFIILWLLWRVGHISWYGRGAGLGSQSSQRGVFGMPKSPQSGLNIVHFMFSREDFNGRVAFKGTLTLRIVETVRE